MSKLVRSLLSLRPHELDEFITHSKILYKYNRLKHHKKYQRAFITLFKDTPYAFDWKLAYDRESIRSTLRQEELDSLLCVEKKVLWNSRKK